MSLDAKTVKALGPAGALARNWSGYQYREDQLDLARAVARALESQGRLAAEAGTGTGKTIAYLTPVLLSGQKAIISTATKNLQEQIIDRDLPRLAGLLGLNVRACLVKGRRNYLCRHRLAKTRAENGLDAFTSAKLAAWLEVTDSGDLAEVDFLAEGDPLRLVLTASSDMCLGPECDFSEGCFITKLRRRASSATVVVVNHHLFMADLALRQTGHGQVLPESQAVVFDEAHELESAATDHFGLQVSDLRLADLAADISKALNLAAADDPGGLSAAVARLFTRPELPGSDRFALTDEILQPGLLEAGATLADRLRGLGPLVLERAGQDGPALERRAVEMADGLDMILGRMEPEYVYYAQRIRRGLALKAAPVEVGGLLNRLLFKGARAFVFVSATLDPPRFRERLALAVGTEELVFESPFDFQNHSRLYVPAQMPPPASPHFAGACADEMERLVGLSRGRAFLLFTSYRNLDMVHRRLAPRLPYSVLRQGEAPKALLIERFISRGDAVLMATHSFWQGVDVPGPGLSLVAIDKLPFAPPDDPLVAARLDRLSALGVNPFMEYQVPEAALGLRQGLGRLIRRPQDVGLLAVLDVRLFTKTYGQKILKSLPPSPVIRDINELARWAAEVLP